MECNKEADRAPTVEEVLKQHIAKCEMFVKVLNRDESYGMALSVQAHLTETGNLLSELYDRGFEENQWPQHERDWFDPPGGCDHPVHERGFMALSQCPKCGPGNDG